MNYNDKMKKWIVLLFLTTPLSLWAQQPQAKPANATPGQEAKSPSLAELAKAAKDRRQHSNKTVRTITNADLSGLKANVTTSTAPTPAAPASDEDQAAAEPDAAGPDGDELSPEELKKWKEAFDEARVNLSNAVSEGLVLQLRMNNLRNAYLRQSDGTTQERVQAQLRQTMQAIETNRQAQREARAAIDQLQRDARAAGLSQAKIRELTGTLPAPPPEILSETTGDGA